ncbi:MAG: EF-hand domain-containing protein [Sphingobium phenoxybenzoativorans]
MSRILAGGMAGLLMVAAGLFWWQGRAAVEQESAPPVAAYKAAPDTIPVGDPNAIGEALPMPASATPESREERRFHRYDRDRDGIITRNEMMASRVKAFRQLDTDHNNLLSFEEWAVATGERFAAADGDGNGRVTPAEFAKTAPKPKPDPKCGC